MEFNHGVKVAVIILMCVWSAGILGNLVLIRRELTEIKLILKYCEYDEVPKFEIQAYEDYIPPSESLA